MRIEIEAESGYAESDGNNFNVRLDGVDSDSVLQQFEICDILSHLESSGIEDEDDISSLLDMVDYDKIISYLRGQGIEISEDQGGEKRKVERSSLPNTEELLDQLGYDACMEHFRKKIKETIS